MAANETERPTPIGLGQLPNPALIEHARRRAEGFENRVADRINAFSGSMRFVYLCAVNLPADADHRAMALAEGPDGSLYITDDAGGRIWRVLHVGRKP